MNRAARCFFLPPCSHKSATRCCGRCYEREMCRWLLSKWVFIFHDISNHCDTKDISEASVRSHWMCWTCFLSSRSLFGESQPAEQEGASPSWVSARKRRTPRSCSSPSRGSSAAERLSHILTRQRPADMSANYRRAGRDF